MSRELLLIVIGLYGGLVYTVWPLTQGRFWAALAIAGWLVWAGYIAGMSRRF